MNHLGAELGVLHADLNNPGYFVMKVIGGWATFAPDMTIWLLMEDYVPSLGEALGPFRLPSWNRATEVEMDVATAPRFALYITMNHKVVPCYSERFLVKSHMSPHWELLRASEVRGWVAYLRYGKIRITGRTA